MRLELEALRRKVRAAISIRSVDATRVFLEDLSGQQGFENHVSVTNDAEAVVAYLNTAYPGRRFIYRDSEGRWDELSHEGGVFKGFDLLGLDDSNYQHA